MKKIKVFINGLGRIGRVFIRQNLNNPNIDIVGLNDPNISSKNLGYLLEFDSTYGRIENKFKYLSDNKIIINKKRISITRNINLDKTDFETDILLDCSGVVDTSHIRNLQTLSKKKPNM
jgi:glyceraldehyde 3-phosphate dehydrogenase